MKFNISNDMYKVLIEELERSRETASGLACSSILSERTDKAKEYAERSTKLSTLIHEIKQGATLS